MKDKKPPFGPIVEWFGVYLPLNILGAVRYQFLVTLFFFGMVKKITLPPLISVNRDLNLSITRRYARLEQHSWRLWLGLSRRGIDA